MTNQTVSLTASNIRYLLAVKVLAEGGRVRCVDVARNLNVARPSALRALEYLQYLGVLRKKTEGVWTLTEQGWILADKYRMYYDTVGGLFLRLLPPEADRSSLILSVLAEVPLEKMDEVCERIRQDEQGSEADK